MTPLEKDALQEIMNISFGQAAADLSDVMNLYITLTVPRIDVLQFKEVCDCIKEDISRTNSDISMVKQFFSGKFSGSSVLIFPHGEGQKILRIFEDNTEQLKAAKYDMDVLEKDALIEISNIIMGACISKIAELLRDVVSYTPPRYYEQEKIHRVLEESFTDGNSFAIFFKTVFHFKDFEASGFLFLICNYETLEWLKAAIEDYLKEYA